MMDSSAHSRSNFTPHWRVFLHSWFFNNFSLKKCALTLVEIIVIILIIGILAIVALPRFSVFYEIRLQGAAKKIVSDIRYAQSMAISYHTFTRIVFDESSDTYRGEYFYADEWRNLRDPLTGEDLELDFRTDYQYKGIDILNVDFGGTTTLMFDWQGIPQDENGMERSGSLGLSYKGRLITITVAPRTGKINVE